MKSTIILALGLALAGTFSFSASSEAAPEAAPEPTEVKKKQTKKKPVLETGTNDGGSTDLLVNCWCSGGSDGNGPAQCSADACNGSSADSCCVKAYGSGAEAEDQ